jgi:hypothetical protein
MGGTMKSIYISLLAVTLAMLSLPVMAFAQIDSGPDGIGIYFDLDATVVTTTAAVRQVHSRHLY